MKLVGWFALGGFGIVAGGSLLTFGIAGLVQGFNRADPLWLIFFVAVGGPLGAAAGAVLALVGLGLQRLFPRRRTVPPATPAHDDSAVWPPPPTKPLAAERQNGASEPE